MARAKAGRMENVGEPAWASNAARALEAWFLKAGNARELPWRNRPAGERDAYVVLVAETMLQQTQVSRIAERLPSFLERFPTVVALAAASEDDVLAEWSGLGYYRRARNLHAAAQLIAREHGGEVPDGVERLRTLPGVGRYTAGAVASLAFGLAEPIVDGNVSRVLLRLHAKHAASDDRAVQGWLWEHAGELVGAAARPGVLNEALMELGATVCVPGPARPACERCPLAKMCVARERGEETRIPIPKATAKRREVFASVVVARRGDGAVLMEKRPSRGMWSNMWQAVTVERADRHTTAEELGAIVGVRIGEDVKAGTFVHRTTHRDVRFVVWEGRAMRARPKRGEWIAADEVGALALSNAQQRVLLAAGGLLSSTLR